MHLLFILMFGIVHGQQDQCAWEQYTTTWTSGRKVVLRYIHTDSGPIREFISGCTLGYISWKEF